MFAPLLQGFDNPNLFSRKEFTFQCSENSKFRKMEQFLTPPPAIQNFSTKVNELINV